MQLIELLKVLKEVCMETAGNFEMIKKEVNELRQHTDELKLRTVENEDREAAVIQVLINSLRVQK